MINLKEFRPGVTFFIQIYRQNSFEWLTMCAYSEDEKDVFERDFITFVENNPTFKFIKIKQTVKCQLDGFGRVEILIEPLLCADEKESNFCIDKMPQS